MLYVTKAGMSQYDATLEYLNAIKAGNKTHIKLVFDNSPDADIEFSDDDISSDGGVTVTTFKNTEDDIKYGNVCSTEISAFIFQSSKTDTVNWQNTMSLYFGVEIEGVTSWIKINEFYGADPSKTTSNGIITYNYVAHDVAYNSFNISADDFRRSYNYGMSLNDFYTKITQYLGFTARLIHSNIDNATAQSVQIPRGALKKGLTMRDVLSWTVESMCGDAVVRCVWDSGFNRYLIHLGCIGYKPYTTLPTYTLSKDDYYDINLSDTTVPQFPAVSIVDSEDDTNNTSYPTTYTGVPYNITNNPIVNSMSSADKTTLLTALYTNKPEEYRPMTVSTIGNWLIEVGDEIYVETESNPSGERTYVFARTLTWNGGCYDCYECTGKAVRQEMTEAETQETYNDGRYVLKSEVGDAATCGVANNLTETAEGKVLDARQGKVLNDFRYRSLTGSSVNLDSYYGLEKAGLYYVGTGVVNSPSPYSGLLVISGGDASYQICVSADNQFYFRKRVGNPPTWSAWVSLGTKTTGTITKNASAIDNSNFHLDTEVISGTMLLISGYFRVTTAIANNTKIATASIKPKTQVFASVVSSSGKLGRFMLNTNGEIINEIALEANSGYYSMTFVSNYV